MRPCGCYSKADNTQYVQCHMEKKGIWIMFPRMKMYEMLSWGGPLRGWQGLGHNRGSIANWMEDKERGWEMGKKKSLLFLDCFSEIRC